MRQRVTSAAYRRGAASPVERMRFRRYVDELRAGRVAAYMAAARRGVLLFLRRVGATAAPQASVRHCFPALAADFCVPRLLRACRVHSGPFLWVAPKGHVEFCHLDPDDGWLAVVSGRKRVSRLSLIHI